MSIFDDEKNKGKKELLEKWGYSVFDSNFLKEEIEKQSRLSMQCGEYELGSLDGYGQRINVVIHLKKDTGEDVTYLEENADNDAIFVYPRIDRLVTEKGRSFYDS